MSDALERLKKQFARQSCRHGYPDINLLVADRWIVSSVLQKSIRRGEIDVAQRAAFTLLRHDGSAVWRRLMVIAFEDVGAGSDEAVTSAVAASTDPKWRSANGGNDLVAMEVARALAEAPKDRSADYLICGAKDCQSAPNFDPVSASNFNRLERRVLAVALALSELVGVAETARARA